MKIRILSVGKTSDARYRDLADDYAGRLRRFTPLELVEIKEGKEKDASQRLKGEAGRILSRLAPSESVIVSDEKGKDMTSLELSGWIATRQLGGTKALAVVIGSAFGLDESLKTATGMRVRLSSMTLPHEMARAMWLEQLYRAFCILENQPYHH